LDLNKVKFVSPCKERGKKNFGKVRFFFYILARLIRFLAARAVSRSLEKRADFFNEKTSFVKKGGEIERKIRLCVEKHTGFLDSGIGVKIGKI